MMFPKPTRVKKQDLDSKLWKIFSEYIRLKYANQDGSCLCVTCGAVYHWKQMHAGHWISRSKIAVKYLEANVHPQCYECNITKRGNSASHESYIYNKYGVEILEHIKDVARSKWFPDRDWYQEKIREYKYKVMVLKKEVPF